MSVTLSHRALERDGVRVYVVPPHDDKDKRKLNATPRQMKMQYRAESTSLLTTLLLVLLFCMPCAAQAGHAFGIDGNNFTLDGKPFQIISGEMHYARIPREYWRDRLKMARAMGLNTISTYVFWNLHESQSGVYDFSGQKDLAAFIRTAQEEGLKVILRPGPYACAEWEFGGYTAWLLADDDIVLRSSDEKFMQPAEKWLMRLGQEVSKLQIGYGGPIIAVQVENEYGSFGNDKVYLGRIRDALKKAGFTNALLYTADGPDKLSDGTLPDLPAVVNFEPGSAKQSLQTLATFRPNSPLMIGEWWAGWFDHWGHKHATTDGEKEARELDWVLENNYSINLYMFHGGTSWGFMNGANFDNSNYEPDVSSYDYAAPLDESGRPTKKYYLFRDVIAKNTAEKLPPVPVLPGTIEVPQFSLDKTAPLFANLPKAVASEKPRNMEHYGQGYGYILYRVQLTGPIAGDLVISDLHDYAQIYVNGELIGALDRRLKQNRLPLRVTGDSARLDILVENTGRINYTDELRRERKGITKSVVLGGRELTGWHVFTLPMSDISALQYTTTPASGPAFYRGAFTLKETGDTFLDLRNWSKGTVWVNGHQLGRFWNIGPQRTLYVPGPWLKKGANEVVVFDLLPQAHPVLRGINAPILDQVQPQSAPQETH